MTANEEPRIDQDVDPDDEAYPGTQPADAMTYDSLATMRPMATQAVFRPNFDDSDGFSVAPSRPSRTTRRPCDAPVVTAPAAWRRPGRGAAGAGAGSVGPR